MDQGGRGGGGGSQMDPSEQAIIAPRIASGTIKNLMTNFLEDFLGLISPGVSHFFFLPEI